MSATLAGIVGGIGLFLLGMILMTDGLKAVAGDALRRWLERFTGHRLGAVATGCAATLVVQSSTATTLATIGFVSAGLLALPNAIGVIIGANLGTTSTGWIVSLLGLKFSMATAAMPLVGIGAIVRLLGRDRVAEAGSVLAGFGLIFVGIDVLQGGMAGLAERIDLSRYSSPGIGPRLLLVGIGLGMTVIMQSSSAAIATTLTAVASGTIGLDQAAALVVGQNVGTTFTAVIAAIGASVPARRTALVHVLFNVVTACIVFVLLPWIVGLLERMTGDQGNGADHALTIAAFHTAFSLLGAALFLPFVPQLARFVIWLLPQRQPELTRHLDPSLREVPALAVAAAITTLRGVLAQGFGAVGRGLLAQAHASPEQYARWRQAAEAAGELVERLPSTDARTLARLADTVHLIDHVRQFVRAAGKPSRYAALDTAPGLRERADELGRALIDAAPVLAVGAPVPPEQLPATRQETSGGVRGRIVDASAAGDLEVDDALAALSAQRWLERLSHHARRALHYLVRLDDSPAESSGDAAPSRPGSPT